ncbi:hypothetical protein KAW18_15540 [candidate division WOR-3 bacterium]|nr:hypothetical protein [candidate division WOR-3 bacterium]
MDQRNKRVTNQLRGEKKRQGKDAYRELEELLRREMRLSSGSSQTLQL